MRALISQFIKDKIKLSTSRYKLLEGSIYYFLNFCICFIKESYRVLFNVRRQLGFLAQIKEKSLYLDCVKGTEY